MGCAGSKHENFNAVALCRDRSDLLAQAIRLRYALSDAHADYAASLRSVGDALHRLAEFRRSPSISLPAERKGDPSEPDLVPSPHTHSRSQSGSHIRFYSSGDSDLDDDSPLHSDGDSPLHEFVTGPTTYFNARYARNNPPEQMHYGSVSEISQTSSYLYPYHPKPFGLHGSSPPLNPPSPPRTSPWDFLNPFEAFGRYYAPNAPIRSSKELREDEDIPDLEYDEQEVIKEAYVDPKSVASTSATSVAEENVGGSAEVDDAEAVEKNIVDGDVLKPQEEKISTSAPRRFRDMSEVACEIRLQFERAAESSKELDRTLEVGKHPYIRKGSFHAVPSRLIRLISISLSKDGDLSEYEEDKTTSSGNLSSTLEKLYLWERKLYDEVRAEKKMRLLLDRNSKKLQRLDERGAEAHKVEATQTFIRKLSTKMKISIQIVNSITNKLNLLRDEELWPQIDELIQGLERMWRIMLECHQIQSQAISEANYLDSIASQGGKVSDEHMNAIIHLEMELLRWIGNFSAWINSQKSFVKALNSWLALCLRYEPEVTADGIPPYSPGRIGASPVFVISNCWSRVLDRVSVKEVVDAMESSAAITNQLWQQNDRDGMEKLYNKTRERAAHVIGKEVEALNRKIILISGRDALSTQSTEPWSLHSALKQLFLFIENVSMNAMKAYEDLRAHAADEKAAMEEANSPKT